MVLMVYPTVLFVACAAGSVEHCICWVSFSHHAPRAWFGLPFCVFTGASFLHPPPPSSLPPPNPEFRSLPQACELATTYRGGAPFPELRALGHVRGLLVMLSLSPPPPHTNTHLLVVHLAAFNHPMFYVLNGLFPPPPPDTHSF